MNTQEIAKRVKWLFRFLEEHEDQLGHEDLEIFSSIFDDDTNVSEEKYRKTQKTVEQIWNYQKRTSLRNSNFRLGLLAERLCPKEDCPVKHRPQSTAPKDNFFNLIVGKNGQLPSGSGKDFVDVLKAKIGNVAANSKFYFYDGYLVKAQTQNKDGFAMNFITELTSQFQGILLVARQVERFLPVPNIKIIDNILHDRYFLAEENGQWKGVLIGSSVTGYPTPNRPNGAHFIITSMDTEDSKLIGEIILNEIAKNP